MIVTKNMNDIQIDIQIVSKAEKIPSKTQFKNWAMAALSKISMAEITIRVVDEKESSFLNTTYRHKKGPTNVLSFPSSSPIFPNVILGDIVICAPLVKKEAKEQGKEEKSHWAHLTVHGILHLLGYDHIEDKDASLMESLEKAILQKLGFPNPYGDE